MTAGSAVSSPSVFFVNVVVAISERLRVKAASADGSPARLAPFMFTANLILSFSRILFRFRGQLSRRKLRPPRPPQHPGAGAGRRAGREHVVHQHDALAVQALRRPASQRRCGRSPARSGRLNSVCVRVGTTRRSSRLFTGICVAAPSRPGQALGLVEFALPLLRRMQRDGHDQVPRSARPTPAPPLE